jgi:tRNA(fMet)-specific endonuclease VapC
MFLFDTDHLVILQDQVEPECTRLIRRLTAHPLTYFYASIISFHEQVAGWNAYLNRARGSAGVVRAYEMFRNLLVNFSSMQVLPFDNSAAGVFDSLRKQRIRIGTMDLRIASVALTQGYVLLSRNFVDFQKVPGLTVEDWTAL